MEQAKLNLMLQGREGIAGRDRKENFGDTEPWMIRQVRYEGSEKLSQYKAIGADYLKFP